MYKYAEQQSRNGATNFLNNTNAKIVYPALRDFRLEARARWRFKFHNYKNHSFFCIINRYLKPLK